MANIIVFQSVSNGDVLMEGYFNDLHEQLVDTTNGHDHDGTDSRMIPELGIVGTNGTIVPPIGSAVAWFKTISGTPSLPSGWVECNGGTISDADSPMNGQSIPDMNTTKRFIRGSTTSGSTGGADTHTLTINEMPEHTHTYTSVRQKTSVVLSSNDWGRETETSNTSSTGGGDPHENMPAYMEAVWIMRIK